jgi:hypothetical protein
MSTGLLAFTLFHTALSLIQFVSGFVVVFALMGSRDGGTWMPVYLASGIATSVTGFMFPVSGFLPSHAFGILSLALFAVILLARYKFHLAGAWRGIFVASLVLTVYLDAFVAIVQAFLKIPSLHALAPNGSEPPFAIAQAILLVLFIALGVIASRSYHPAAKPA